MPNGFKLTITPRASEEKGNPQAKMNLDVPDKAAPGLSTAETNTQYDGTAMSVVDIELDPVSMTFDLDL